MAAEKGDLKEKEVKLDDFELNANKITDRIWLGSEDAAHTSLDILSDKHDIKYILVAGFGISAIHENNEKSKIKYKKLKCIDLSVYDITKDIIEAIKWIEKCLNEDDKNGGNLLIHCARGKSRSASICIGYLMWKENISFEDAKYLVRQKRKIISINAGFEKQLKQFDETKKEIKL